jgi:hypothetical protein
VASATKNTRKYIGEIAALRHIAELVHGLRQQPARQDRDQDAEGGASKARGQPVLHHVAAPEIERANRHAVVRRRLGPGRRDEADREHLEQRAPPPLLPVGLALLGHQVAADNARFELLSDLVEVVLQRLPSPVEQV